MRLNQAVANGVVPRYCTDPGFGFGAVTPAFTVVPSPVPGVTYVGIGLTVTGVPVTLPGPPLLICTLPATFPAPAELP